jgi:hypothetical protein
LSGVIFEYAELSGAYFCIGVIFLIALAVVRKTVLPIKDKHHEKRHLLSEIIEGIKYARSNRVVTAI